MTRTIPRHNANDQFTQTTRCQRCLLYFMMAENLWYKHNQKIAWNMVAIPQLVTLLQYKVIRRAVHCWQTPCVALICCTSSWWLMRSCSTSIFWKLIHIFGMVKIRAAHHPYYNHGHIIHGSFTDTVDRILSICSIILSADSMVWVLVWLYYSWWK